MYLPKEVILEMLYQVDPRLTELPLYLSSDIGNQKSTSTLYLDVFEDLKYNYSEWIHYGIISMQILMFLKVKYQTYSSYNN